MEQSLKKITLKVGVVILFYILFESGSHFILKKIDPNNFKFDTHPLLEAENGRIRLRKDPFASNSKKFWVGVKKNPDREEKNILGIASFFKNEGLISGTFGDIFVNKWGFRGPYFEQKKPENIYRIVALGASTTLGWWVGNEMTYPRLLERMLNNKLNQNKFFQVINAGQYYHQSCDMKRLYKEEILKFDPDLLLIMSGWNDIDLFRGHRFKTIKEYCKPHSFLNSTNTFKLLKFLRSSYIQKKKHKKIGGYVVDHNFEFYKNNLEEVIGLARKKRVQVGLVSIPSVMQNNMLESQLKKIPQLKEFETEELKYRKLAGLRIDGLYRELIKKYSNVFYIASGLSFNSEGKQTFFSDSVHPTESGNRVQAFAIYQNLIEKLKIHEKQEVLFNQNESIPHNLLEIGYVKGIFQANQIEDLSYSGCIAFHGKCDIESNKDNLDYQINGILEFVLGSWLQFRNDVKLTKNRLTLSKLLSKALEMKSNFSLTYWVTGILNKEWQEDVKANKNFRIAYELNPLLKTVDFEKEYQRFQNRKVPNPFLVKLDDLIFILKKAPKNVSSYTFFWWLKRNQSADIKKQLEMTSFLYYSNPLMVKSIFDNLIITLIKNKIHPDVIREFLEKIKQLKPEYNFKEYFSSYDDQIKIAS